MDEKRLFVANPIFDFDLNRNNFALISWLNETVPFTLASSVAWSRGCGFLFGSLVRDRFIDPIRNGLGVGSSGFIESIATGCKLAHGLRMPNHLMQRWAVDQFHGVEVNNIIHARKVDRLAVRMMQLCSCFGFAFETHRCFGG